MMKFFRKHRKAVSPVIAVMLLVAVAVAAVGAYFIWFRSFQAGQQEAVREATGDVIGPQLSVSATNDATFFYITIKNNHKEKVTITKITPGKEPSSLPDIEPNASKTVIIEATSPNVRNTLIVFAVEYKIGEDGLATTYSYTLQTDMSQISQEDGD